NANPCFSGEKNIGIFFSELLLFKDYNIQTANDGNEGMIKAFELIPDIIISDVMMPEMDGISLMEKLKGDHRTSHIPIILLTAKADVASRLTGLTKGADAYLSKPFNKDELIIELKKLLELRRLMQERYSTISNYIKEKNNHFRLEDDFIKKIKQEMEANLSYGSLNIEALCHVVAMSRAQLYRKFKSLTNKTLGEYFRTYRLSKARELLQNNKHNVSEAAYQTGFKNLSHFSRVFTEEFGVNPSDLQK
ncbi:MAG: helix-turn-helix domain-containing protein, partial [Bacteroidales bacterium]|nr:helix-turn-helix domain-containing protein [Bacteroidales bacterium]